MTIRHRHTLTANAMQRGVYPSLSAKKWAVKRQNDCLFCFGFQCIGGVTQAVTIGKNNKKG